MPLHRFKRAGCDAEEKRPFVRYCKTGDDQSTQDSSGSISLRKKSGSYKRRRCDEQKRGLGTGPFQKNRHEQRTERCTDQIGEVECRGDLRVQMEDHRQRHSGKKERNQWRGEIEGKAFQPERKLHNDPETDHNCCRVTHQEKRRFFDRRNQQPSEEVQSDTTQSQTEQCKGNRNERIVVPDRRRVNTRQTYLEHKSGKRDQEYRNMSSHPTSPNAQAGSCRKTIIDAIRPQIFSIFRAPNGIVIVKKSNTKA